MSETEFNESQIELIKKTIAKGATDDELRLFMATCKRTGLDPFSRQIYMIERSFKDKDGQYKKKMEMQASVDGLRLVAERTGVYQGQDGPYWCGPDGKWSDVWLKSGPPSAAKVGVLKKGFTQPLWAVAKWESYCQTSRDGRPNRMWEKMGDVMLAKCAESLALRRGFPNDLSGIYTGEEMGQADNVTALVNSGPQSNPPKSLTGSAPRPAVTDAQIRQLFIVAKQRGWSNEALKEVMTGVTGYKSTKELCPEGYKTLLDYITTHSPPTPPPASGAVIPGGDSEGDLDAALNAGPVDEPGDPGPSDDAIDEMATRLQALSEWAITYGGATWITKPIGNFGAEDLKRFYGMLKAKVEARGAKPHKDTVETFEKVGEYLRLCGEIE